jgi:hypothetical protein
VRHPVRPALSFWQIWNMCFGFLGLQFGFALQNANVSRIFQTLGADLDQIPSLWIAAPLTGLLVQPVVGYLSDRTWTRLGRRRPYFLTGALLAAAALWCMPRARACGSPPGCCGCSMPRSTSRWNRSAPSSVISCRSHNGRSAIDAELFHRRRCGGGQRAAVAVCPRRHQ